MKTILRNNIMSGPMLMVMSGKPWTKNLTVGGNVYLSIPSDYALGQDERIEPDLSKLIEGIPERRYRRLAPRP